MRLVYFAEVRELIGQSEETIAVPETLLNVADLIAHLKSRGGGYEEAMSLKPLCVAINQEFAIESSSLEIANEVAFFPPVSGG